MLEGITLPHPGDRVGEAIGVYRLYQIVDCAFRNRLLREIRLVRSHDAKTSGIVAEIAQHIKSGHIRQCDINKQQIRRQTLRSMNSRPTRLRFAQNLQIRDTTAQFSEFKAY